MACRLVGAKPFWTNAGILLIQTLRTSVSEILHVLSDIQTFSFTKMHFKMSSGKWWPFCLGLNVLSLTRKAWTGWVTECRFISLRPKTPLHQSKWFMTGESWKAWWGQQLGNHYHISATSTCMLFNPLTMETSWGVIKSWSIVWLLMPWC